MSTTESVFFLSAGARLHAARHAGASGRRPLVVVPGITTPAGGIAFAAERLCSIAGDVYILDMRGRGLSERVGFGAHRAGDYARGRPCAHRTCRPVAARCSSAIPSAPVWSPTHEPNSRVARPVWSPSIHRCRVRDAGHIRWASTGS